MSVPVRAGEQVSSDDHHQMSLAGLGMSRQRRVCLEEYPYYVTYPIMHVMLPTPLKHNDRQALVYTYYGHYSHE